MSETENQEGGAEGQTDGPVFTPISISLNPTGTITAYTTINATATIEASKATGPINVVYSENGNTITVPRMPHPVWNSDGTAPFQININQALIDALSSRTTTLVVTVNGDDSQGTCNIPIAFPPA